MVLRLINNFISVTTLLILIIIITIYSWSFMFSVQYTPSNIYTIFILNCWLFIMTNVVVIPSIWILLFIWGICFISLSAFLQLANDKMITGDCWLIVQIQVHKEAVLREYVESHRAGHWPSAFSACMWTWI